MVIHRSPTGPVALAIDIGSSSVRALIYDQNGTQMPESEARRSYRPHSTDDGGSESNADELVRLVVECVDEVVSEVGTAGVEIAAVGITSFWHGLLGLGVDDRPVTPVYMWSDRRSGDDAKALVVSLSAQDVHARTGCRLHSSYWPAKIHWWRRTQAQKHPAVAQWVSITDYLSLILCGGRETSVSMASGTGLLNRQTLQWDAVLLAVSGIDLSYLPSIVDRDEALPSLLPEFARRWPSLVGVPWFPAIGDGAAANVGAGCVTPDAVAMTIGTSAAMRIIAPTVGTVAGTAIPERLWCYRLDRKHEVIGGALSNGGNVTAWLAKSLFGQGFDVLTRDASQLNRMATD